VETFGHLQRGVSVPLLELFDSLTNKLAFGKPDNATTFRDTIRFRKSARYARVDGHLPFVAIGLFQTILPTRSDAFIHNVSYTLTDKLRFVKSNGAHHDPKRPVRPLSTPQNTPTDMASRTISVTLTVSFVGRCFSRP